MSTAKENARPLGSKPGALQKTKQANSTAAALSFQGLQAELARHGFELRQAHGFFFASRAGKTDVFIELRQVRELAEKLEART